MIDKKINDSIDLLIKKLKEKDLVSIKITNKTNSIEVTNNLIYENSNQRQVKANLPKDSEASESFGTVSYTHLTLPTTTSV